MKTFKIGGIHPNDSKLSATSALEVLPLPKQVVIPLSQHIGAPATPIVAKGDRVKVGTKIAQATGFVSSAVHSSVSGTVAKIEDIADAFGVRKTSIVIDVEGDEWEENIVPKGDVKLMYNLTSEQIVQKIADAGIVGLGGATFPTQVKLTPPPGKVADILIINGVECEPYLTADHRLMVEKSAELLLGIQLLMRAVNVKRAIIGVENNKPDAIEILKARVAMVMGIEVAPLKMKYPQGSEKQLIQALTGREVPSGALPIEVGVVVQNVGTAYAVYEAVVKNKPLFERVVTVTGKKIQTPKNFIVRLGTPIQSLIEAVGGMPADTGKVICGGPMMGRAALNLYAPVTKGLSGVLLMPSLESARLEADNCIRCTKCLSACCMGLEPYLLMNYSEKKMWDEAQARDVADCVECGACSFVCPSNRPLLDYIRLGKSTVLKRIREASSKS